MARDVVTPSQGARSRHLNIVYFVDSAKSYSLRVSLVAVRWIVALSIGILLWAIISVGWIVSLGSILNDTRDYLGQALSIIFEYQVKYDKVFEQAYPEDKTPAYYAQGAASSTNSPIQSDSKKSTESAGMISQAVNTIPNGSEKTAVQSKAETTPAVAALSTENLKSIADQGVAESPGINMDVKNFTLKESKGVMTLVFDISNKDPKRKAEGYIWAVASLDLASGGAKKIAAPSHVGISEDGSINSYKSTYKFSIQRFKRKDFSFAVPTDQSWKIASLIVSYVDEDGLKPQMVEVTTPLVREEDATQ
jgi:hypothetical protein